MQDSPDIPKSPPEISVGWVWTSLVAPPLATLAGFLTVPFVEDSLVGLGVLVPFVLGLIGVCYAIFYRTMIKRYRGMSMTLMEAGYLFGQLIVCSAIGIAIEYFT